MKTPPFTLMIVVYRHLIYYLSSRVRLFFSLSFFCRDKVEVAREVISAGVNGTLIFLAKGKKVQQRLRGKNLVTKYGLPEVCCMIPNKAMRLGRR